MNEVQRRQKALAVVRDMDTDAIIGMLETAPQSKIPFPAMRELETVLKTPVNTGPTSADLVSLMTIPQRDPNRTMKDDLPPLPLLGTSETVKVKANPMRRQETDTSTVSVPGEGKLEIGDIDVSDTQKENVDYLGKLYPYDGSEQQNHSDDEGWL